MIDDERIYQEMKDSKASYAVEPPRKWRKGTDPMRVYPQACFGRGLIYALDHASDGVLFVHGESSLAFGWHCWVEIPGRYVFDGVFQQFFRLDDYYGEMAHARPWYKYTVGASATLYEMFPDKNRWDIYLGLPYSSPGTPPLTVEESDVIPLREAWIEKMKGLEARDSHGQEG